MATSDLEINTLRDRGHHLAAGLREISYIPSLALLGLPPTCKHDQPDNESVLAPRTQRPRPLPRRSGPGPRCRGPCAGTATSASSSYMNPADDLADVVLHSDRVASPN